MTITSDLNRKIVIVFSVLVAAFVFLIYSILRDKLLLEPDLWWHIKAGQGIIAQHAFPHVDEASWSQVGQPWIAKEWLSQVVYAFVYQLLGWAGPFLLGDLALVAAISLAFWHVAKYVRPQLAVIFAMAAFIAVSQVSTVRPHIITFSLGVVWTINLFNSARQLSRPSWWTVLIILAWVNFHASFPIAFAIAGCAFIDFLHRGGWRVRGALLGWIVFFALCGLCTLANPYFIQPYLVAFDMAKSNPAMATIDEWAPLRADQKPYNEAFFVLVVAGLLWLRPKLHLGQLALVALSMHMMLLHIRFVYVFYLLMPLAIMPEIAAQWPAISYKAWAADKRDNVEEFLGRHFKAISLGLGAIFAAYAIYLGLPGHVVMPESVAMPGVIKYIQDNQASHPAMQKRLYNSYNLGGPLIFYGIKVYVDGRSDQLYLGDFISKYYDAIDKESEFTKVLAEKDIGWTVMEPKDARNGYLSHLPGWEKTYADDNAVIYERKG